MKKRIAFITSSPSIVRAFLENHIKLLSSIYDIYVLSNIEGKSEKKNLAILKDKNVYKNIEEFATFIHVGITRRISIVNDIQSIVYLWKFFRKEKFSAAHSITSKAGLIVMISGVLAGVKHRFHTYTGQVWANKKGGKRLFFKAMDRVIAVLCTNCYADSKSQMEFLIEERVVNKNKISVLGKGSISGVDTKRFFPDIDMRNKFRERLSLPENEIVFLLLCRLTKDKGVLDLAKAFSHLVKQINCSLLIVGPDEDNITSEIKSIVGNYGASKLIFQGYTTCSEAFLNAADILCLPSYREGFGSIIIDAAAVGIPAIGSNIYGIHDAIVKEETGILHTAGDIDGIYNSMHRLAVNEPLRRKMGKAALLRATEQFAMEKITGAWLNEYKKNLPIDRQFQPHKD